MLASIYIENIALIKKLSLDISKGFCAFTGETGAGKSIIIDSLCLLLGKRGERDIIRTGEDEAFVEGVFSIDNPAVYEVLEELDIAPEDGDTLIISRKISRDGRSGTRVNGRTVTLHSLGLITEKLFSIHGQQDTQEFRYIYYQLGLLDSFAEHGALLDNYTQSFVEYNRIRDGLASLTKADEDRDFRRDMLTHKIGELRKAKVRSGEKEQLEADRKRLANSEKIVACSSEAYDSLYDRDGSALERIGTALNALETLSGALPEAMELAERLEAAKYELKDIAETVKSYLDDDFDDVNARLDECETRLEQIKRLESKYKADASEFKELLRAWEDELSGIENLDEERSRLEKQLADAEAEMRKAAEALTASRKGAAKRLCARITEDLASVDLPNVHFEVSFAQAEYTATGADAIEFLISANKGEEPKPLAKIASGGELSRIMLCLKCVFADKEAIGTLIFDEIDSGVSGSTSEKIAKRLKLISGGKKQVICVTHSAILASKADAHYKIKKSETDGRVITTVEKLDREGRKNELARILGGMSITETVLKAASELLDE